MCKTTDFTSTERVAFSNVMCNAAEILDCIDVPGYTRAYLWNRLGYRADPFVTDGRITVPDWVRDAHDLRLARSRVTGILASAMIAYAHLSNNN